VFRRGTFSTGFSFVIIFVKIIFVVKQHFRSFLGVIPMQRLIKKFIALIGLVFILSSEVEAGDVWFIDTRPAELTVKKLSEKLGETNSSQKQWIPATMAEFQSTHNPEKPLLILIHGNWTTSAKAKSHGILIDRLMKQFDHCRVLVWTWNSDRIYCKIRKDALIKAQRAEIQAKQLTQFLQELKPNSKISLVGFSFGAKLVCETLQLLATSQEEGTNSDLQIRSVLLAGALDRNSLMPGKQYGQALNVTEKMLIHINPDDETLCYYPLLAGIRGPQAVGKEGALLTGISKENQQKIKMVNVQPRLGSEHAFLTSFRSFLANKKEFRFYALFED
jgi:pimeloyl-ACP methyl ester carboxylesterase